MNFVSTIALFTSEFLFFSIYFIFFSSPWGKKILGKDNFYKFALLLVLSTQIIAAAIMKYQVGDVGLFSSVGAYLRTGGDFYSYDVNHTHFPFFPFLIFLHAPLNLLAETIKTFTFSFYLKLVLLIPLWSISYLILKENKSLKIEARSLQLQFLTAPVTFCVILFHGQVDLFVITFFILAGLIATKKNLSLKDIVLSGFAFGASIAVKTWSVFLLPMVLRNIKKWEQKAIYIMAIGLFLFVDVFIYTRLVHSAFRTVLPALLSAGGGIAYWGYSYIIHLTPLYPWYNGLNNILVFIPTFLVVEGYLLLKKFPFWKTAFLTILVMYVLLTRWGIQYIFWIYPFMFLIQKFLDKRERFLFIALTSPYALLAYWNDITHQKMVDLQIVWIWGFVIWVFCVYWLVALIKRWSRS